MLKETIFCVGDDAKMDKIIVLKMRIYVEHRQKIWWLSGHILVVRWPVSVGALNVEYACLSNPKETTFLCGR